jgi:CheY-like chemotaxis protein
VETAINGEDGLQKIKTTPYNLILLDVMMPKLDGLGVLAKLKEDTTYTFKTPIMLLTNLAHDPAIQNAVQQGAVGFLIKADLSPDQLVTKIKPFISA